MQYKTRVGLTYPAVPDMLEYVFHYLDVRVVIPCAIQAPEATGQPIRHTGTQILLVDKRASLREAC
jgi:hypothetical protein